MRHIGAIAALSAFTVILTACSSEKAAPPQPVGTWGSSEQGQPQLVLADDGKISGTDGCNRLVGSWKADGAKVDFGQLGSTMMFCEGVDTWLSRAHTGTVAADTMTVSDETGAEIGTLARQP